MYQGRNYPDNRFLKIAGEVGCRMILGIDAHMPERVGDNEVLERARALASHYGITLTEDIRIRSPFLR